MGLALAQRCLEAGARVTIVGRHEARLQAARDVLGTPTALDAVVADVSHEEQVADLFERIDELDHVVSTVADIKGAYEQLPDLDLKAVQRAVDSKIYAPLLLAKHGAPKIDPKGSITFTSGIAAYRP